MAYLDFCELPLFTFAILYVYNELVEKINLYSTEMFSFVWSFDCVFSSIQYFMSHLWLKYCEVLTNFNEGCLSLSV